MPGLTHIGIAFIMGAVVPNVPLWALLVATEFIDLICIIFCILGIEKMPTKENAPIAPYSHGLFMALIWTLIASLFTWIISSDIFTTTIIGVVVFSHWVLDFIASPMTYAYPNDTGKPIFFQNSRKIGLGLWSSKTAVIIGEYVVTLLGFIIYIISLFI